LAEHVDYVRIRLSLSMI